MNFRGCVVPVLLAGLSLLGSEAQAWDSVCHQWDDPTQPVAKLGTPHDRGCEGVAAAHGRWRDPVHYLDEHRVALQHAAQLAGLPDGILETVVLAVPTLGNKVDDGDGKKFPQLRPIPLDYSKVVARFERRGFSLDELAQLPDFSYSLADWAGGNERCPIPELATDPVFGNNQLCHQFKTHLGALNSSHFPPQSDRWYRYLHNLAKDRALDCQTMRSKAMAAFTDPMAAKAFDNRWHDIWRECEIETLAIEAVAQHYLQDSWSSGHMWQRWGSASLSDFPDVRSESSSEAARSWNSLPRAGRQLMLAEIVGIFAGTIHGSDPALYEASLESKLTPKILADPVCYPTDERIAYVQSSIAVPAAGDMHLHDVLGDPLSGQLFGLDSEALHDHYDSVLTSRKHTSSVALATQKAAMVNCSAAGLREVYDLLGDKSSFGSPTLGAAVSSAPLRPNDGCDSPRLNARALSLGIESQSWASRSYSTAKDHGGVLLDGVPKDIDARAFHSYDELRRVAQLLAIHQPGSTAAAELHWDRFDYVVDECEYVDVDACVSRRTVSYSEPPGDLVFFERDGADGIARNQRFAAAPGERPAPIADPPLPWGDPSAPGRLVDDSQEQVLAATFHRAHAPLWCARTDAGELKDLEDRTKSAAGDNKLALCQVCTEVVARHVRPPSGKSLCDALVAGSVVLDGDGDPSRVAERRCGCADNFALITDAGLSFLRVDNTGALESLSSSIPAGSLARDAVSATRRRIFVTNGEGDIVGFRWAGMSPPTAVEMDLTPSDPTTLRYRLGGNPQGIAFLQSLGKEWLLVVDNQTDTLSVFDLGTEADERFKLCSSMEVGRDPARVEGAYDIVIQGGTKAFVSLRGPTSTPGDAIAMIDVAELLSCDGINPVVTHVTGFGTGQGLGALSLSPDEKLLAAAGRFRTTCIDQIFDDATGASRSDTQVGCDQVSVLKISELTAGPLKPSARVSFGLSNGLTTRPLSNPYAVAWHPGGDLLAYGSFSGPGGWPRYADFTAAGGVALGTISAPAFPPMGQKNWSYKAPLDGYVGGEVVEFAVGGEILLVATWKGTSGGTLYGLPAARDADFWQRRNADPEIAIHSGPLLGAWYGGCRVTGRCPGGFCPANCPAGATDVVHTLSLGAGARKLLRL